MHILYVNKISPRTGGGAELRLWELARHLSRRGHEVHIVCGKNLADLPDEEVVEGVHLHYVHLLPSWVFRFKRLSFFLARYLFYLRSFGAIAQAAKEADIVVDCATPVISGVGVVSRRLGKPCVVTIYETFGRNWFKLKGPVTATLGYFGEFVLFRSKHDAYVTLSQQTYNALVRNGKPKRAVHYLRHGAGVVAPPGLSRSVGEHNQEVICISRLVKQKNLQTLLRSWSLVRESVDNVCLRIIGDGPERQNLERYAQSLGVADSLVFEGRVSDEEKWHILQHGLLFVLPSLQEGFGIVLLEAMVAGLPVVAFDLPVFREFLRNGEHGYLVTPGNHGQLADRIMTLIHDADLRRRIGEGNAVYSLEFSWERATDQEEAVLLDILSKLGSEQPHPSVL